MSLFALFTLAKPQISGKGYKKSTFAGKMCPVAMTVPRFIGRLP